MTLQEQINLIVGPQAPSGTYYDQTLLAKAKLHGEACPAVPPQKPLEPTEPRTVNFIGPDEYKAAMEAWAKELAIKAWLDALNSFDLLHYYDLAASVYAAHARSGDPSTLLLADKCADSWAKHPTWIDEGRKRLWIGELVTYANGVKKWRDENAAPPPRHAGIIGLTIRALRGRRDLWDWINTYTRFFFDLYVNRNLTQPLYDLREGAFSFRFAVLLSQVLPDSFPLQNGGTETNGAQLRAQYLADIETAAVQYFGRTQSVDGSWRWNDDWRDSDDGSLVGVMQPFMVGLLLRALCDAHQVAVTPTVKENIKNQILNGCRHLYSGGPYIKDQIEQNSGKRVRGFQYLYHGGTSVNPTRYVKGDIIFPWTALEAWWVPGARQAISTILGAFGYAFKISGDEFYRTAGNELFDSAYGGGDGLRAMMDGTAKNFNQHVWGSSSYQAWIGGVVTPPPSPLPIPPAPAKTPSPDGFKGTVIIDADGAEWTIGSKLETLKNNVHMSAGFGHEYKYLSKVVYVKGTDVNWYKWNGSVWGSVGPIEPGVTIPGPLPPNPTPIPPAPPPPPVTPVPPVAPPPVEWPKQISKQNALIEAQRKEGYYLKHIFEGIKVKAEFEKVP